MATKKTAKKSSSRAKLNIEIDKPSKKTSNKIKKQAKKINPLTAFIAIVLLLIGAVGGYFGIKELTKNDCFELKGKDTITLTLNETYFDEGVTVIAFNKDDEDKVVVETNLKQKDDGSYYAEEIGTYYITYNVTNLKYGSIFKIQKVRLIDVVEPAESEELENLVEVTNEEI